MVCGVWWGVGRWGEMGATVIEVNPEPTPMSSSVTVSLRESAGDALPTLLQRLPELLPGNPEN